MMTLHCAHVLLRTAAATVLKLSPAVWNRIRSSVVALLPSGPHLMRAVTACRMSPGLTPALSALPACTVVSTTTRPPCSANVRPSGFFMTAW
eukprot:CAMPEP_0202880292 /NCGR_PEP_ID=MMETSP1391-20130828/34897_1 /ASSEMBLY_ACC=CAM_ASM_000867 /TAXON_ID=1034604 /ORGANISM="Chlamydomonas leiostraca, Strain SAG 11-49" /LENGTH=91 /DNA_ID=CAMNT_0049562781 /DNA_START=194 /DNA_END=469 /DNA_ORIENTATION=-